MVVGVGCSGGVCGIGGIVVVGVRVRCSGGGGGFGGGGVVVVVVGTKV